MPAIPSQIKDQAASALLLRGGRLGFADLLAVADGLANVSFCPDAAEAARRAARIVESEIARGGAVYGVSRGVGALKAHNFDHLAQQAMTGALVAAHTGAYGPLYPATIVRLAMTMKLNSILTGRSGVSEAFATMLSTLINLNITPEIPSFGSIGCGDILPNGHLGLAMSGEGYGWQNGHRLPMAMLLAAAGLTPLTWQMKDAIGIISHNALSVAHAAVAARQALATLDVMLEAALFAAAVMQASPAPWGVAARVGRNGIEGVGAWLIKTYQERPWPQEATVHDPLHMRFMPEVFGPAYAAIGALIDEIEGLTQHLDENPVVDGDTVATSGGSHCLALALHIESARTAMAHIIRLGFNHAQQITSGRRGGLATNLVANNGMTGFGPFLKLCGALLTEAVHHCNSVSITPLVLADGLEDEALHHALSLSKLERLTQIGLDMAACLAVLAAQGSDLNGIMPAHASSLKAMVREIIPFSDRDRSLAGVVEALSEKLKQRPQLPAPLPVRLSRSLLTP